MIESVGRKKRVLVFIVAYNAERTIQNVIRRIPVSLAEHETEILIIDDSSRDNTFEVARAYEREKLPFPMTVLYNPVNQGYGGNQKLGFHYAIRQGFDIVALVHGDGQYAPEELPKLLQPLLNEEADAVFGSRMMNRFAALKGGMPLYKYVGNRILSTLQNWVLGASLSEFHSGYRLYSVKALAKIPFERNTNDFHFDTDIIIQFLRAGLRIRELPIPTFYGDEICHVNGIKYARNVVKASLVARAQDLGIFYQRKFDVSPRSEARPPYRAKLGYDSSHTLALDQVERAANVLGVGFSAGLIAEMLRRKGCSVTQLDPLASEAMFQDELPQNRFDARSLGGGRRFNCVLLLDILEHLRSPEAFLESLRASRIREADTTVIVSSANVAFFITRLMLFLGFFNYGSRGILDLTHRRLFTFSSMQHLLHQAGYVIEDVRGIPAPFPLALGNTVWARALLLVNRILIGLSKGLFSYQIFMIARPLPSIEWLLQSAADATRERVASGSAVA